jgi:ribonuclease HI
MSQWRKNGYQNGRVQNRDLFEELDREITARSGKLKVNFVRAHEGIPGNEAAHKLAFDAATARPLPGQGEDDDTNAAGSLDAALSPETGRGTGGVGST